MWSVKLMGRQRPHKLFLTLYYPAKVVIGVLILIGALTRHPPATSKARVMGKDARGVHLAGTPDIDPKIGR